MTLQILVLTRYGDLGPSSRYRSLQYRSYLMREGIEFTVRPLFDNDYVSRLYRGAGTDWLAVARSITDRLRALLQAGRYDLVWIEKEALPFVPGWLEAAALTSVPRYVVDYDDAVFHLYDQHPRRAVRCLLGRKHDWVMRGAVMVIAGNDYLAARARAAGAERVEVLPTVVDLERYAETQPNDDRSVTIGWIGSPGTAKFLEALSPVIEQVVEPDRVRFRAIGSGPLPWAGERIEVVPWSEDSEVAALRSLSIGVMPLPDNPFERGKCGLKLIQYMAVGLPVVASPVGVNREIVEQGVNGYLCETTEEWVAAIRRLAADPTLRCQMGQAGRRRIEERYSLQVAAPRLAHLLREAAASD